LRIVTAGVAALLPLKSLIWRSCCGVAAHATLLPVIKVVEQTAESIRATSLDRPREQAIASAHETADFLFCFDIF
jgi:hypothetical protein